MKSIFIGERIDYTGRELRSHWIFERFGIRGDCIVAFVGGCRVERESLVDLEDALKGEIIVAKEMLHFIAEFFGADLIRVTLLQRLLCAIAGECINRQKGELVVERRGDDLFIDRRKLSVSIATVSPVSGLIHLGVNLSGEGTPEGTASLEEIGIDVRLLAEEILSAFETEFKSALQASYKVRPVE